ncbi:hypothetical protein M9H77_07366 [Catharanthus roseus]|uniref:Uncharacterized protein n=1 Tax=Catharanthus roseus TaxID=4058 RepID=A0ACC0BUT8_CATRO|nr:hypothetical protein M9H77_07366 [Catharanthus roseus]
MDSQSEYGSVDTELDDRGGHSLMESQGLLLFLKDRKPSLEAGGNNYQTLHRLCSEYSWEGILGSRHSITPPQDSPPPTSRMVLSTLNGREARNSYFARNKNWRGKAAEVSSRLPFFRSIRDPEGYRGGIWLLWNDEQTEPKILSQERQACYGPSKTLIPILDPLRFMPVLIGILVVCCGTISVLL